MVTTRLAAGGVVFWCGQVLLLRTLRETWVMPKGKVKAGEAPERAAVREVREESGLCARLVSWVSGTMYRIPGDCSNHVELNVRWYLMEATSHRLSPEPIFSEAAFFDPEEALQRLTYHTDRGILLKAAHIQRHGPLLPFCRGCPSPGLALTRVREGGMNGSSWDQPNLRVCSPGLRVGSRRVRSGPSPA